MDVKLEPSWKKHLEPEFDKEYFKLLAEFVRQEYQTATVYPPPKFIFKALDACPFDQVQVVILGQDPYHGAGQANGLSFSVNPGVRLPPSLMNIYKELENDLGLKMDFNNGDLSRWAKQGVLMLNATLTVRGASPGSHQNKGWEEFTDAIIRVVAEQKEEVVFILWGAYAQKKGAFIDEEKHLVIKSPHPSPFSADKGFFGSKPFSRANDYLQQHRQKAINWQ
jgi:uracil-DNA glycosylase